MNLFKNSLWVCLSTIYILKCTIGMVPKRGLVEILNSDALSLHPVVEGDGFEKPENVLQLTSSPLKTKKNILLGENCLLTEAAFPHATGDTKKRSYREAFGMGGSQALSGEKSLNKNNHELQLNGLHSYFIHPDSSTLWRLGSNYDRGLEESPPQLGTHDFSDQTMLKNNEESRFLGPEIAGPSNSLTLGNNKSNFMTAHVHVPYLNFDGLNEEFSRLSTIWTQENEKQKLDNNHHSSLKFKSLYPIPSTLITLGMDKLSLNPTQRKPASFNFIELNSSERFPLERSSESQQSTSVRKETNSVSYPEIYKKKKAADIAALSKSKKNNYEEILLCEKRKNENENLNVLKGYKETNHSGVHHANAEKKLSKNVKGEKLLLSSMPEYEQDEGTVNKDRAVVQFRANGKSALEENNQNNQIVENQWEAKLQNVFWVQISNIMKIVKSEETSTFSTFENNEFIKAFEVTLEKMENNLVLLMPRSGLPVTSEPFAEANSKYKLYKLFKELLNQGNNLIKQSLFDDMTILAQEGPTKNFKYSAENFFKIVKSQIEKNGGETFYITNKQAANFLLPESRDNDPRIYFTQSDISDRSYYLSLDIVTPIKNAFKFIPCEELFKADEKISKYTKMRLFLGYHQFSKFCDPYTSILRNKIYIRNIFLMYSTIINKIFRESTNDESQMIFERQKVAIEFFDSIWSSQHLKFDAEGSILFLDSKHLPLPKEAKRVFLKTYQIRRSQKYIYERFPVAGIDRYIQTKFVACWRLIALWLAKCRYDLYKILFTENKFLTRNFKNLITSIVYFLANLSMKHHERS
ncbi:hypothetical protein BY996DRAFT_6744081 [Phakopsora pachyrhizi]|uniref:Expressed protein n=1 Tax=Phakopsora pachyrhizi TaxID=170000 RepID=A0AAV0AQL1_PHAPC|nr:hypothetical protein BY996DRAFT_6744081 [Phakopsora pachyrhizi]CAH7671497.1 expressed protein [Phakopsora pachyrhizi]